MDIIASLSTEITSPSDILYLPLLQCGNVFNLHVGNSVLTVDFEVL